MPSAERPGGTPATSFLSLVHSLPDPHPSHPAMPCPVLAGLVDGASSSEESPRSAPAARAVPCVCTPGPGGSRGVHLCRAPRQSWGTWFHAQPALRLWSCPSPSLRLGFLSCTTNCGARTVVSDVWSGEPQGSVVESGWWAGVRVQDTWSSPPFLKRDSLLRTCGSRGLGLQTPSLVCRVWQQGLPPISECLGHCRDDQDFSGLRGVGDGAGGWGDGAGRRR